MTSASSARALGLHPSAYLSRAPSTPVRSQAHCRRRAPTWWWSAHADPGGRTMGEVLAWRHTHRCLRRPASVSRGERQGEASAARGRRHRRARESGWRPPHTHVAVIVHVVVVGVDRRHCDEECAPGLFARDIGVLDGETVGPPALARALTSRSGECTWIATARGLTCRTVEGAIAGDTAGRDRWPEAEASRRAGTGSGAASQLDLASGRGASRRSACPELCGGRHSSKRNHRSLTSQPRSFRYARPSETDSAGGIERSRYALAHDLGGSVRKGGSIVEWVVVASPR